MTTTTILAKAVRTFPAPSGYRGQLIATAELHSIGGQKPYFSITGEISTPIERQDGNAQCYGCIHEKILKVWPEAAPLIAMHLSDEDGKPMHAFENGFYWLCKAAGIPQQYGPDQSAEECFEILCDHFRIDPDAARSLIDEALAAYRSGCATVCQNEEASEMAKKEAAKAGREAARFVVARFTDNQAPRWKAEADAAIAMIHELAAKQAA